VDWTYWVSKLDVHEHKIAAGRNIMRVNQKARQIFYITKKQELTKNVLLFSV
jgi:hypothetical protein